MKKTLLQSEQISCSSFPALRGGAAAVAHWGQRFNSPGALTGTTQEEREKTVYIYMTQQHFSLVCNQTSEGGVTDLVSMSSSTVNILDVGAYWSQWKKKTPDSLNNQIKERKTVLHIKNASSHQNLQKRTKCTYQATTVNSVKLSLLLYIFVINSITAYSLQLWVMHVEQK